ncbi:MAG: hypothetical protein GC162_06445 [Planctomycetes bacterium]|nr:hypothetical protein [Planctomycetota bacterium]
MRRIAASFLLVLSLVMSAYAEDLAKPLDKMDPQAGDTIVFLGDSITHQCLYTQYVEDYFYTRYPAMRVHFYNSGVSGDIAADALKRFDIDVAELHPKYVTILLGMNDASYRDWDKGTFDRYEHDMTEVLDRISKLGATAIAMKPTMHDFRAWQIRPTGQWKLPKDEHDAKMYNAVLSYYGAWLQQASMDRGLGVVDLSSPLSQYTLEARRTDANFTMIPDSVHPDPNGHAIMAFELLQTMHPDRAVSRLTAICRDGTWQIKGGDVTDVSGDASRLKFTFTAKALPWVLPSEASRGFAMTHAGHKMSNERLSVVGLAPGKYKLTIDGVEIGTYTNVMLGGKVELENNDKTPQYQQALAVAMLNKERNDKAVHPMRDRFGQLKGQVHKGGPDEAWMAKFKDDVAAFRKAADDYESKIYDLAQPKPRVYELTKVD